MVTASSPRVVPPTVKENIQTSNTTASPRCLAVTQTLKWSDVAELLPGRLGKQCRERWFNHLDPSVKKTPWSPREDEILFNAQVFGGLYCVETLYGLSCFFHADQQNRRVVMVLAPSPLILQYV